MLLDPFSIAPLGSLKNRVAMSSMTRGFAGPNHLATPEMAAYYGRRAEDDVALILTEGTIVHLTGDGYNNVPHIETAVQAKSWAPVVQRVRSAGTLLFCQLWHCGRISHSDYTGGVPPVSSTDRPAEGINRQNGKPFGTPRSLDPNEMTTIHRQFVDAAQNALSVGFDGVELHFGHGYLIDEFLDGSVNDRTDRYGGSVANRCRFALELLETVIGSVGADKVMVRLSPSREMEGIHDWPDMGAMLDYLVPAMSGLGLAMLDISCARSDYALTSGRVIRMVRPHWKGFLMGGASLSQEQAESEIRDGHLDMVTWGRFLLANPDFVGRLRAGAPLEDFSRDMLETLR
mgnify:FL=1